MRNRLFVLAALTIALAPVAHGQSYTESTFHKFTDYEIPSGTVAIDAAGNLYGANYIEGGSACGTGASDCSFIFKLNPSGSATTLHTFDSPADGANPVGPPTLDAAGNLYGVTSAGGLTSDSFSQGLGVIFEISAAGKYSVLHEFAASGEEGANPQGPLVLDAAGNLYGSTAFGGTLDCAYVGGGTPVGCGVVFKLTPQGVYSVLHTFEETDGSTPQGNLVLDSVGNIYGTTEVGGANPTSEGVVFKLAPGGEESVLYSFCLQCASGWLPGYIVRDSQGNIYGNAGGPDGGAIFKIDSAGQESVLYTFCSAGGKTCPDGSGPVGGIVDSAGVLYGSTREGGNNHGVVYKVSAGGRETVLYTFPGNGSHGQDPFGISMDSHGNIYGTAIGTDGSIVFKLTKK